MHTMRPSPMIGNVRLHWKKTTKLIEGSVQIVSEEQVFHLLDNLGATSAGTDGSPHWVLRMAAPSFAAPIACTSSQFGTLTFVRAWTVEVMCHIIIIIIITNSLHAL